MEVRTILPRKKRMPQKASVPDTASGAASATQQKPTPEPYASVNLAKPAALPDYREEIRNGKERQTVIPSPSAPVKIEAAAPLQPEKKLRVAGYCRVSTGHLEQASSILNQREHYEEYIRSNPDWEFAGIYWEADVSGTKAETRPELQRLIADCKAGRIQLILTKSISRFARNTTECLEMVRTLTALGVNIRFEKEGINTGTMESEFLLSLFSSFAEEESRSISANETWAIKKQFENGTYRFSIAPFGYDLVDGTFEINEEQAPIVREIFAMTLSGKGTTAIAKELQQRGIPTGTKRNDGSPGVWNAYMVNGIIKNVVYIGDVLHQKTFHEHFKLMINHGERQQYYNEGHHPAIIDRETFELANEALKQRGREKGNDPKDKHLRQNPHNNRYAFSGRLICAGCGQKLKRVTQKTSQGIRCHWVCTGHVQDISSCSMKREMEENVKNAFCTMMNKLDFAGDVILDSYIKGLRAGQANAEAVKTLEEKLNITEEEKRRLALLLSKGCVEPVSYRQKLIDLEQKGNEIRLELSRLQADSDEIRETEKLKTVIRRWKRTGNPDAVFTEICEGATVRTGEWIEFHLKCGLRLRESLEKDTQDGEQKTTEDADNFKETPEQHTGGKGA